MMWPPPRTGISLPHWAKVDWPSSEEKKKKGGEKAKLENNKGQINWMENKS